MGNPKYTLFDLIRDPYPVYKAMQKSGEIHWNNEYHHWCVVGYTVSRELLKDPRLSSDFTPYIKNTGYPIEMREKVGPVIDLFKSWLFLSDPPNHTVCRKILSPSFSPSEVALLEPKITEQAALLLEACEDEWDVMEQFAEPLAAFVITEIMGLPKEDASLFFQWNTDLSAIMDAVIRTPEVVEPALKAIAEQKLYFKKIIEAAVRSDKPSFIKTTYQGMQEMDCDVNDLWKWLSSLLLAGVQTSRDFIGSAILALLQHPSQFQLLRDKPSLLEAAVEELLRYEPSIQSSLRIAMEDISIADVTIKSGEFIRFFYGAINRNPKDFEKPDVLDITRSPNKHLSFAAGIHFCLGQALARTTASIAIPAVLKHYPNLKLVTQDPEWVGGVTFRGLKSLGVKSSSSLRRQGSRV